jgi:hypothetical protein
LPHPQGTDCANCHNDPGGSWQGGDCLSCHSAPQDNGDSIPPDGRRAILDDFGRISHHVSGGVQQDDCLVCHELSQHQQGRVRLVEAGGSIVELVNRPMEDAAEAQALVSFCLNCHDGGGDIPFSGGLPAPGIDSSSWDESAHANSSVSCMGDGASFGCHANGHGSDDEKILAGGIDGSLCSGCHSGFGTSHAQGLGTTFTANDADYTLACTTCHNPHVVTGEDSYGSKTPITRPNLSADPFRNPRAVGSDLWGDSQGEKMDDFAAGGIGSGGFYYSVARGGISFDQPAVYQPPDGGMPGDVLPDFATFCLDCHSVRMGSTPPVNWGQGIACTDNSVDPPDQRIECGAQHGLAPANMSSFASNETTAASNWGSGGNSDILFHMNYVTRGRGAGHFMRQPYKTEDRIAGINYVMSCSDCHVAHSSSSMGGNWNSGCNDCHYYYGGQHAGMSCGNASCHEANSIHRIIHVTESGNTRLALTESGYEDSYERPDFTPEIVSAQGIVGSNALQLTFAQGAWSNSGLSSSLDPDDFWSFDNGEHDSGRIVSVSHTPGDSTATLTLNAPIEFEDLFADTIATRGLSVWCPYEGGYENYATGIIPAQPVSAGPWPVVITPGCPTGSTRWDFDEPAGSPVVVGEEGAMIGAVSNPAVALPGDGYFHGDGSTTYIEFLDNPTCLQEAYSMSVSARVKPTNVHSGGNTFNRIFERRRCIKVTILHTDYRGDDIPEREGKASIEVKYFVDSASRHDCPHPQWPDDPLIEPSGCLDDPNVECTDPYTGNDARWHQISSDIDQWPIVDNHWYEISVTFSTGTDPPVSIYIDDQGEDGDGVGELWSGNANATKTINESSSCRWGALPDDYIALEDQPTFIGSSPGYSQLFSGQIDWVTWAPW